jgi:hypothetical protein
MINATRSRAMAPFGTKMSRRKKKSSRAVVLMQVRHRIRKNPGSSTNETHLPRKIGDTNFHRTLGRGVYILSTRTGILPQLRFLPKDGLNESDPPSAIAPPATFDKGPRFQTT